MLVEGIALHSTSGKRRLIFRISPATYASQAIVGLAMSSLPPPNQSQSQSLLSGSLTKAWAIAVTITHLLIAGSLIVLAISANTVGKPTWWLQNSNGAAYYALAIVPFLAPTVVIFTALRASRFAPLAGLFATVLLATSSILDISRSPGIALGEAVLAGCCALTTIAATAGRRRSVSAPSE